MSNNQNNKAIDNFQKYLKIKTVHPNPDYVGCLKFLQEMAAEIGLKFEVVEFKSGIPVVIMTLKGENEQEKSILLSSHYDVVPVSEECWDSDPFGAEMRDNGDIVARGSQDMKCVGMAYLEAIRKLKSLNPNEGFKRTIHLVFTPDEEIGSPNGAAQLVNSDVFEKLNVGVCFDEGFPSPSNQLYVFSSERSTLCIKIVASGTAGHGSSLPQGTATERLLTVLRKFSDWRGEETAKLVKLKGDLGQVNSVNITMLSAGKQHNVIPETAEATVDIRISPSFSFVELEEKINDFTAINGVSWSYTLKHDSSAISSTDPDNIYWSCIAKSLKEWYSSYPFSDADFEVKVFPGGTDSRFYRAKGLPAYGISPFCNTPTLPHDHNEFLNAQVFLQGIEIYVKLIENIANC